MENSTTIFHVHSYQFPILYWVLLTFGTIFFACGLILLLCQLVVCLKKKYTTWRNARRSAERANETASTRGLHYWRSDPLPPGDTEYGRAVHYWEADPPAVTLDARQERPQALPPTPCVTPSPPPRNFGLSSWARDSSSFRTFTSV